MDKPTDMGASPGADPHQAGHDTMDRAARTDLAVFQRLDHTSPFRVAELALWVSANEVRIKTTAKYDNG